MAARSKARKRALDILFESEARGVPAADVLAERSAEAAAARTQLNPYVATLVDGVVERQPEIDRLLSENSTGWALDRMPAVDRTLLRIGVFELMAGEVPSGVVLSEAVELATELSTDESPQFVNGLLARIGSVLQEA